MSDPSGNANKGSTKAAEKKLQRKLFTIEEDAKLRFLVAQYGNKDFKKVASFMPGRTPRQVRERYKNYLSPEINNGPWSREEDALLRQKYQELGPKWSKIADFFPSRSDINVKNRWTSIGSLVKLSTVVANTQSTMAAAAAVNMPTSIPTAAPLPAPAFSDSYPKQYCAMLQAQQQGVNYFQPASIQQPVSMQPTINQSENIAANDMFCHPEEFERDDSNYMFSFDSMLNAEQNTFVFDDNWTSSW